MADIKLTPTQFNAIPVLAKQVAAVGLKVRKFDGVDWLQLDYISAGANGNWNITISKIILDNRKREAIIAEKTLDDLRDSLRQEVRDGSLTLAQSTVLFGYVRDVILALQVGWVPEAKVACNSLATSANASTSPFFTAGRKTFMLNQIDAAIALL